MTNNSNKTDTHIYNIINNPPKEFTEPCFACGVSEFQLGVKHAEERIIKMLEPEVTRHFELGLDASAHYLEQLIGQIKGEQK